MLQVRNIANTWSATEQICGTTGNAMRFTIEDKGGDKTEGATCKIKRW